jgi:hypothetical protein
MQFPHQFPIFPYHIVHVNPAPRESAKPAKSQTEKERSNVQEVEKKPDVKPPNYKFLRL